MLSSDDVLNLRTLESRVFAGNGKISDAVFAATTHTYEATVSLFGDNCLSCSYSDAATVACSNLTLSRPNRIPLPLTCRIAKTNFP